MGLFSKFKQVFKKEEKKQEDIEAFDKGLEKTRKEFVSELSILGHKYHKVNDDYFEELEAILIKADIGIRTVTEFLDRLRKRVKDAKINRKFKVVSSTETPIPNKGILGTNSFIPGISGLLCASYVFNDVIKK